MSNSGFQALPCRINRFWALLSGAPKVATLIDIFLVPVMSSLPSHSDVSDSLGPVCDLLGGRITSGIERGSGWGNSLPPIWTWGHTGRWLIQMHTVS